MKLFHAVLVVVMMGGAAGAESAEMTAYVGATLIDGTGAAPVAASVLLVVDGRIAGVGAADGVSIPDGARIVEVTGLWLVPGLIDAHVHLAHSASLYTMPAGLDLRHRMPFEQEDARTRAALAETLVRYVASGVTAVADRGGPGWTLDIARGLDSAVPAPRIAVSGSMLATYSAPPFPADDPPSRHITDPEQARAMVRDLAARGADMIKIHFLPSGPEDFERALSWVRAAADAAHEQGLGLTVHATDARFARAVVEAGADQLVHSIDDGFIDDALLGLMAARGTVVTTTLLVHEGYREVFTGTVHLTDIERALGDPVAIESLEDLRRIPSRALPRWLAQSLRGRGGRLARPVRPPYYLARDTFHVMAENLRRMVRAGVIVAAGTDAGTVGNLHGPGIHRELELMAEAGLSPMEILVAATRGGAQAMARAAEIGTLEPGKRADFLLLDADPLVDVRNLRRLRAVFIDGRRHDPDALRALLESGSPMR